MRIGQLKMTMLDVAGQSDFQRLWGAWMSNSDLVICVVDASDWERFPQIASKIENLMHIEKLRHIPWVVMANKQDFEYAKSAKEVLINFLIQINSKKSKMF